MIEGLPSGYTVETWGGEQWFICYEGLVCIFERVADNPTVGVTGAC